MDMKSDPLGPLFAVHRHVAVTVLFVSKVRVRFGSLSHSQILVGLL